MGWQRSTGSWVGFVSCNKLVRGLGLALVKDLHIGGARLNLANLQFTNLIL
ncbi:MAG: hypothetical protein K0R08_1351 [Solimicrobium sp.]|jgi:hypothetical protein|nr:hypothetical protein [Solimicrobium sp.]